MNPCPVMMAQGLLRLLVVSLKKGYRPMPFACMLPAIETIYAAAIINGMFFTIDAGGFAFGSTKPASITFRSIDTDLK